MTSAAPAKQLFRSFLRESTKITDVNLRKFTQRRVRDHFEEHRAATNTTELLKAGQEQLKMVQRQVIVQNMYHTESSVIDHYKR